MLLEILVWLEQYSGIIYSFRESMDMIAGDYAFGDPFSWKTKIELCLEEFGEILDLIDEHKQEIPDDLPDARNMKKIVTDQVLSMILKNINNVKQTLLIDVHEFRSYTDINMQVNAIYELIRVLIQNPIEVIYKNNKFENLNKELNGYLVNEFGITRSDISQIHFNANDARDNYLQGKVE